MTKEKVEFYNKFYNEISLELQGSVLRGILGSITGMIVCILAALFCALCQIGYLCTTFQLFVGVVIGWFYRLFRGRRSKMAAYVTVGACTVSANVLWVVLLARSLPVRTGCQVFGKGRVLCFRKSWLDCAV